MHSNARKRPRRAERLAIKPASADRRLNASEDERTPMRSRAGSRCKAQQGGFARRGAQSDRDWDEESGEEPEEPGRRLLSKALGIGRIFSSS